MLKSLVVMLFPLRQILLDAVNYVNALSPKFMFSRLEGKSGRLGMLPSQSLTSCSELDMIDLRIMYIMSNKNMAKSNKLYFGSSPLPCVTNPIESGTAAHQLALRSIYGDAS